jgi:hypothetical protein
MKPRVCVTLILDSGKQVDRCLELSQSVYEDAAQRLDIPWPLPGESVIDSLLCSDPLTTKRVLRSRRELAEMLSAKITDALLDHLGVQDTIMGYSKEQWQKMYPLQQVPKAKP